MEVFVRRLKQALFLRDMKQADLARATGVSESKISCYVGGRYKPNGETLRKIASALDVPPEWLLGFGEMSIAQLVERPDDDLTDEEVALLEAYHKADETKKQIVRLTLGL